MISCTPTPPVSPPSKVKICIDPPGVVDLRWDDPTQQPSKLDLTQPNADGEHCAEIDIQQGVVGLTASCAGHSDLLIV